jgi:hypothetical protein
VLHHFVDFKAVAASLISKLPRGGQCFMLEPRADFHITASLLLKLARANSIRRLRTGHWSTEHEKAVGTFVAMQNSTWTAAGINPLLKTNMLFLSRN